MSQPPPYNAGYANSYQPQPADPYQPQPIDPYPQPVMQLDQYGQPIQPPSAPPQHQMEQSIELQIQNNNYINPHQPVPPPGAPQPAPPQSAPPSSQYISSEPGYAVPITPGWVNEDELPPEYKEIEPVKPGAGDGCVEGCKATKHYKAWFLTIVILFLLVCWLLCYLNEDISCGCECYFNCTETDDQCDRWELDCDFPCLMTSFMAWWFYYACIGFVYLIYISESICCSSSRKYLSNIHEDESIHQYVERLCSYPPTIWWRVECWHNETRTRTSTVNGKTTTQTYTVKVVTHRARKNYKYNSWKDASVPLSDQECQLTKLSNYKKFTFRNTATLNDYNQKAAAFKAANNRDRRQSFFYGMEIQGFKRKMLIGSEPGKTDCAISLCCFVLHSLFLCTTCYRMYFAAVCGRKKYMFNKQVSI